MRGPTLASVLEAPAAQMLSQAPGGMTPQAFELIIALSPERAIAALLQALKGRKIGPKIVADLARHPRGAALLQSLADAKPERLLFLTGKNQKGRFSLLTESGAFRWNMGAERGSANHPEVIAAVLLEKWGVPKPCPRKEDTWAARRKALVALVEVNIANALRCAEHRRTSRSGGYTFALGGPDIHREVNCPTLAGKLEARSRMALEDEIMAAWTRKGRKRPQVVAYATMAEPVCFLGIHTFKKTGSKIAWTGETNLMVAPSLDWWLTSRRQAMTRRDERAQDGDPLLSDWVLLGRLSPRTESNRWLAVRAKLGLGGYEPKDFQCAEVMLLDSGCVRVLKKREIEAAE